jgi:hypothetical protein
VARRHIDRHVLLDALVHRSKDTQLHQFRDEFEGLQADFSGKIANNDRRLGMDRL